MSRFIIFPDQDSFRAGLKLANSSGASAEPLYPPHFCDGFVAPSLLVTGGLAGLVDALDFAGVPVSGVIPHSPFRRALPKGEPPEPVWRNILGALRVTGVYESLTDPLKLRVEAAVEKGFRELLPLMARLIRGGTYRPDGPALAFEEGHRLIVITSDGLSLCRVDDLLDMWILIRTTIDLAFTAWRLRSTLKPETEPRYGIGTMEIFKRLPGTNCRKCGNYACMEFAAGLLTGRRDIVECPPLFEPEYGRHRESLKWVIAIVGIAPRSQVTPHFGLRVEAAESHSLRPAG